MKSYKNLFQEVISDANIEAAIREACRKKSRKNKRKQEELRELRQDKNRVKIVRGWIENYKTRKCPPKEIYDGISGKLRLIYVPSTRETVVQHAVVRVLEKYLSKGRYEHTYAAIKGRGSHRAKRRIQRWIKHHPGMVKYYLKADIRQYFPSIPQDKMMAKLEKKIKDHKLLTLIQKIIAATDHGIPLGYYISQWLANFYLQGMDHYIKEQLRAALYPRWMDDIVVFDSNKRRLHKIRRGIAAYLEREGLEMKGNWRVDRFCHGEEAKKKRCKGCFLDFMGFRFYRNRTTIRESIFYRITRKARRIGKKEKPTLYELRQFLSYIGWLSHTDSYRAYLDYVKLYIDIQSIKRRTSRHDKRERRKIDAKSRLQESDRLSA